MAESAKIIIVFDTCSIRDNLRLNNNSSMELFRNLRRGADAQVALPQVVIDELNGYLAKGDVSKVSAFNGAVKTIRNDFEKFKTDNMLANFETFDSQSLAKLEATCATDDHRKAKTLSHVEKLLGNFDLIPYPKLDHADVVSRCLREKRPFKRLNQDEKNKEARYNDGGYRDTLIWHSACGLAKSETDSVVVFVSTNTTDFGDNKGNFHEDLIADLATMGIAEKRVLYLTSIDQLNNLLTEEATKRAQQTSSPAESEEILSLIGEKALVTSDLKQSIETQDISDLLLGMLIDVLDVLDDSENDGEDWISRSTFDNFELLTVSDQCETRVEHPNQVIVRAAYFARLVTVRTSPVNRSDKHRFYRGSILTVDLFCDTRTNKILVVSPLAFAQDPLFECFVRTRQGTESDGKFVLIVEPKELAIKAIEREFMTYVEFASCMLTLGADYRTIGSSDSSNMNAFSIPTAARSLLIKFGMLSE